MDQSWLNFIRYNNYYIKKNYNFFLKFDDKKFYKIFSDIGNINYTNKNDYNFFFDNFNHIDSFAYDNFLDFKILPLVKPFLKLKIYSKGMILPKKANPTRIKCKKLVNLYSVKNYFYF